MHVLSFVERKYKGSNVYAILAWRFNVPVKKKMEMEESLINIFIAKYI